MGDVVAGDVQDAAIIEHAEKYVMVQFEIWQLRSQMEWKLDISFLDTLGIQATVTDRIR